MDDGYFAPLDRLELRPETELCLGLVHYTDGLIGTRRRLATAQKYVKNFSIATFLQKNSWCRERIPLAARSHRFFGDTLLKAGHLMRSIPKLRGRFLYISGPGARVLSGG